MSILIRNNTDFKGQHLRVDHAAKNKKVFFNSKSFSLKRYLLLFYFSILNKILFSLVIYHSVSTLKQVSIKLNPIKIKIKFLYFLDVEEESLRNYFSVCGVIENIRLVRDSKTLQGKGIGYVTFQVSYWHNCIITIFNAWISNPSRTKVQLTLLCAWMERSSWIESWDWKSLWRRRKLFPLPKTIPKPQGPSQRLIFFIFLSVHKMVRLFIH